jgi:hypothetical protein
MARGQLDEGGFQLGFIHQHNGRAPSW